MNDHALEKLETELCVDPDSIWFGELSPSEVATRWITVQNCGHGSLELDEVRLESEGTAFTMMESVPEGPLGPGDIWEMPVLYEPQTEEDSAIVWVLPSGDLPMESVELYGWRDAPGPGGVEDVDDNTPMTFVELAEGETKTLTVRFTVDGRLDVAFLIDTTQSMDSLIDATISSFQGIATNLSDRFGGTGWGLATFDDYPMYPWGRPGLDLPYQLQVPVTTDTQTILDGLSAITIHDGQDAPESSLEALYQATTGAGYDLLCDGEYDVAEDVPPFYASPDDPFGGSAAGVGASGTGGMGFRDGRLPVIVYATNYELRDSEDTRYSTPGGCAQDAGMSLVADAINDLGAKVVGVSVYPATSYTTGQMEDLATRTASLADLDGNGTLEPAVVEWSSSDPSFETTISDAITQLVEDTCWDNVWLDFDDPWGIVSGYVPQQHFDVCTGETVTFTISLTGVALEAPATLRFDLVTTGGVVLATELVVVRDE
ncbi:MAG: hypothetical protein ACOZNI_00365 [Myxococcota bacterium]